jgi:L-amino acid N-acyltransferase YncA
MEVQILQLEVKDWRKYKKIRLEALLKEPLAIMGSIKEEKKYLSNYWKEKLAESRIGEKSKVLFAIIDNKIVGMIGITYNQNEKLSHMAMEVSFYVNKNYRGIGIGRKLKEESFRQIRIHNHITKVISQIVASQKENIEMNKKFGFKVVGRLKKQIFFEGKYYDGVFMEKFLVSK